MDPISIVALGVAIVSAVVAIWQGILSRRQLQLARDTEGRTNAALEEIKRVTAETRQLTNDIKQNIDDRITKILDSKLITEQQGAASGQAFAEMLMKKAVEGMGGGTQQ
ncbi:hypothetical protein IT072_03725 [Leifsonia sp. ZF2019]|uniref:hypothetical protein n=1 Tax=Leifsonia sp. ZF2019 TaxID=2781978 RepID=UPI001CBFECAF|nr:hypothetical protein [Leifsonia sp. ZF2019]UAJ80168.1 hypothetical protein IT072_03725 [Leifsonia sp. ZF2019]